MLAMFETNLKMCDIQNKYIFRSKKKKKKKKNWKCITSTNINNLYLYSTKHFLRILKMIVYKFLIDHSCTLMNYYEILRQIL